MFSIEPLQSYKHAQISEFAVLYFKMKLYIFHISLFSITQFYITLV